MKIIPAIVLSTLFATANVSAAESAVTRQTAEEMMARIGNEGGKKVLSELWENEQEFEAMLNPVEAAAPQWFEVWVKLREFSDAAISESIDIAFARALPIAPERVLKFIGHGLELNNICGSPFIEPEPGVAEAYERNTLKALANVHDIQLQPLAKECAAHVKLNNP